MPDITRIDQLARAGYLARAVVYGLLGYLALYSSADADEGPEGAFDAINDVPGGDVILYILVAGLVAYGIYKLVGTALDLERKGSKPKAIAERLGLAVGGVAYLTMAYAAYKFASDVREQAGGESGSQEAASTMLDLPLGGAVIALAGVAFLVAAAFQLRGAITAHFMRTMASDAPPATCTLGRIGLTARTVVYAIVGWSLLRAAWQDDGGEVRDLGGVLVSLRETDTLYTLVAVGLIVFALFSALEARYRIVPRVDMMDAAKAEVRRRT
jgi:hypothetical protein